jgi:mono/diheme cytochrome c family protein
MLKLLAGCLLAWVVLANNGAAQQTQAEERGLEIAQSNCSRCHAVGRTGESPRREAPPFRTLSRNFPVTDLEEALVEGISSGNPIMPEFEFSPEDAHALVTYLESIQDRQAQPALTGHPPTPLHPRRFD